MAVAYVSLNEDQTEVIGHYHSPQNEPQPLGYAVVADDDPRLIAYLTPPQPIGD